MQKPLHLPEIVTASDDGVTASFVIEPLHRGFGMTIGNSLRRVLMSSLEGAAITAFKVEGVSHEFTSLPGVIEDVVQISLNLKKLRFKMFTDQPLTLEISKKGKGPVTGKDIKTIADVEVMNPEQPIATLDNAKSALNMSLRVEKGRGYLPVEGRSRDDLEVDMILLDALFTPVRRVRYKVGHTRVGQITGLDKLTIDITTDGTLPPADSLQQAAAILMQQLAVLAGEAQPPVEFNDNSLPVEGEEPDELNFGIEDLNLSPRTTNALINNQIASVRDLIQLNDSDLRSLKGFGSKAYQEVVAKLKELELR